MFTHTSQQLNPASVPLPAKNAPDNWKTVASVAILYVLCLACLVSNAEQPIRDLQFRLQEAQVARREAERRAAELHADLARTERQLAGLRTRLEESRRQANEFRDLEFSVASLLTGQADHTETLSAALSAVEDVETRRQTLGLMLESFTKKLSSVLDVLQASDLLRQEVTAGVSEFRTEIERPVRALPSVAGRGGANPTMPACRVLAVNGALQLVVLDAGLDRGVRHGMNLTITNPDRTVVRIRVVDVRSYISGAAVTHGTLNAVGPGAWAKFGD